MSIESLKLHIKITKAGPRSFKATIIAPNGEETVTFSFPLNKKELDATLDEFRRNIKNVRGIPGSDTEEVFSSEVLTPQMLGDKLFKTIFSTDEAKKLYEENRYQSRNNRRPLQCVLEIDHRLKPLINLPWEYLYDEGRGVRGGFFAFDSLTPIIRRWQGEKPMSFETDPPLRVLVVSAQPKGDEQGLGNLSREVKIIEKRLQTLNRSRDVKVKIDHLAAVNLDELKEIIRDQEKTPHVIHFIGHGKVGELFFEDRDGQRVPVSEETLLVTLQNAPSLRLVLLNACRTAASEALDGQLGVAQSLADAGIPAVIAMQFAVSDDAAETFADEFYKVIAEGKTIEQAVTWGRIAIKDKLQGAEWGTPVFYLQTDDGNILRDLLQMEEITQPPPPPPPSPLRFRHDHGADELKLTFQLTALAEQLEIRAISLVGESRSYSDLPSRSLWDEVARYNGGVSKLYSTGKKLYHSLINGDIAQLASHVLQRGRQLNKPVQFELRFDADQIPLTQYPWELIANDGGQFLVRDGLVDLTRYVSYPQPPPILANLQEKQLLQVISQPNGLPDRHPIDLSLSKIETLKHATFEKLIQKLLIEHIPFWGLQFDGHSALGLVCPKCNTVNSINTINCHNQDCNSPLSTAKREGFLAFECNGAVDWISTKEFGSTLFNAKVQLALLLASETVLINNTPTFNGVGPNLLLAGIPAVLGMQYSVSDEFASKFASSFYQSLYNSNDLLRALRIARQAGGRGTWYSPALYLRHQYKTHNQAVEPIYLTRNIDTAVPEQVQIGKDFLTKLWIRRPNTKPRTEVQLRRELEVPEFISINREEGSTDIRFNPIEGKRLRQGDVEVRLTSINCNIRPQSIKLFVDETIDAPPAIFVVRATKTGPISLAFSVWQDGRQIHSITHYTEVLSTLPSIDLYLEVSSESTKGIEVGLSETSAQITETEQKRRREEEIAQQIANLRKLLDTHIRRRNVLQEQVAYHGKINAEPAKLMELQDLDEQIETIEKQLRELTRDEANLSDLAQEDVSQLSSSQETQAVKPVGPLDTGAIKQITPSIRHQITRMYTEGIEAFQDSNWGEAVKRLSNAQKLAPDLPGIEGKVEHARRKWVETEEGRRAYATLQAQYKGGMGKFEEENWEEAAWILEDVVAIDAGYKDAYDRALEARKNADAEKAEAEKQHKLKALYTDALTQEGNKEWVAAVDALNQIIDLDEHYEDAQNKLNEAIRQRDMATNYQEGIEAYKKKEWRNAAAAFSKVSTNRKENEYRDVEDYLSKSRHQRSLDERIKEAEAYLNNENWDEAIKPLTETGVAEERSEGKLALDYALAQQHYERGEWEQSAERFKNIIAQRADYRTDVEDKYAEAMRQARLARLYQEAVNAIEQSSWSEAKTRLEKIRKEDENYPELQGKLSLVDEELHLHTQYTQAQKEINARQWASAIPVLEDICRIRSEYRDAENLLEQAQEQVDLNAIYNRGIDAMGDLNWQEAYEAFQRVHTKSPNFRQTKEHLQNARSKIDLTASYQQGIQAFEQGNTDYDLDKLAEAMTLLKKASEIDPDYQGAENKYHRAKRAHKLQKLFQDGQSAFDKALANKNEGNWEEAIAHWTKLVVEEGESGYRIDESGNAAQKLKEAERQKRLRDLYQDAKTAMADEDWTQAISLLKNLTVGEDGDPDYPQATDLLTEAELQQDLLNAFSQAQQAMKQEEWSLAIERSEYIQQSSRPRYRVQDVTDMLNTARQNLALDTNYHKGMEAINAGNWNEAVRCFTSVRNINSEYRDVEARLTQSKTEQTLQRLCQEGETALQEKEWETAIEKFARIHEINPNYKEARQKLAEAHKQKKLEEDYSRALEHLDAHRWEQAIPLLEAILATESPYRQAQTQLEGAKEEIWLFENYGEAREKVKQENWGAAIQLLEQINQTRSNYENVTEFLNNARKQQNLRQLYDRATVLDQDGIKEQWPEALKLFTQILDIDEEYKDALSRKFDLEERIKQAGLEEAYHQAKGILSTNDDSRWNEGIARLENIASDYKPAQELLEKTRQAKSERFDALRQGADNAKNTQNWAEAIDALKRLTVMEPDDIDLEQELKQAQARRNQQTQQRMMQLLIGGGVIFMLLICLLGAAFTQGFGLFAADRATSTPTEPPVITPIISPTLTLEVATDTPAVEDEPVSSTSTLEALETSVVQTTESPVDETPATPTELLTMTATVLPATATPPVPTPTPETSPTETPTVEIPLPAGDSSPVPTPFGKIAVPVFDGSTYNVYIARAENDWKPELFFENGSQPAFSKNGDQLILRSWRSAEQGYGQKLVLIPSLEPGTVGREMTNSLDDAHPSLRNNDNEIVLHTRREGSPLIFTLGTWQGAESSQDNQILIGEGENPDWLGNLIVYYFAGPPAGLYLDGRSILKSDGPLAPAVSPDGDMIAVSLNRNDRWHIYTLSASIGENSLTQLTTENADDQLPAWSPDGQFIAFVSNQGGKWAVWVIQSDGNNRQHLFDLPGKGSIDGQVVHALDKSQGWGEEKLSWAR